MCQDLCFFSSNGNFTIVGVFDGHGKEGEHIVEFCIREADNFFENLIPSYENKPEAFLTDLLQSINTKIRDPSFIVDIANSGCCCVLALLHKNQLYIANIGNSRAVLATNKDMNMGLRRPSTFCEEKHFLREIAKRRMNKLIKEPNAQELTYPHTTENQKEFMRILRCGGRLQQNSDKFGNRSGPYYIWKNYSNVPGLIVSRTIGNIIAEDIGVISSHYSHQQKITAHDEFLVLASEGIWAVMTNEEVINYITAYKDLAIKDIESERNSDVVNTGNSCIAQLLCEEARIRWLLVVEHENIMIDDITCVILEFDHRTEKKSQTAYRMPLEKIKTFQSTRFAANDTENF